MPRRNRKRTHQPKAEQSSASVTGVLEKAVEVGSSLPMHPVRAWHNAEEGTQELADVLPDMTGLNGVKSFIRRYPVASTCAALALGYIVLRSIMPRPGSILRSIL